MKQQIRLLKFASSLLLLLLTGITPIVYAHPITSQQTTSSPWHTENIGAVGRKGTAIVSGDTFRVWGSGRDIGGNNDQFCYTYSSLAGNGELVAHMISQDATDNSAKAGLMFRETLANNAPNVFLALTPHDGITLQWRGKTDGTTEHVSASHVKVPQWMKLVRQNNNLTGWTSSDGSHWTKIRSVTISMSTSVYIGLAVTAHNETRLSRAVFLHVLLSQQTIPPDPSPTPDPSPIPDPSSTPRPLPPVTQSAALVYGQGDNFTTSSVDVNAISLNSPFGVALDSSGDLYVADAVNNRMLYYPASSTTATRVYGQGGNFSTNTASASTTGLNSPGSVALDSSGNLYVADEGNSRVLYYPAGSITATRVYGQGGSFSSSIDNKGGVSSTSLSSPFGIALDSNSNLYVADTMNNRVLYYPAGSTTATRVYGQAGNFSASTARAGTTGLNSPDGVALDSNGNLYIADSGNSRVLYYPAGSTTATRVYGQGGSFTANTASAGTTGLNVPDGVALNSGGNLYIADSGNNRVLYYPAGSTTATQVYGQEGSFATNVVNKGGISATGLNTPDGIVLDSGGNLYIADDGNSRVLYYPRGITMPTQVYGQTGSFTTNTFNVSAISLNAPFGMAVDSSSGLYVADSANSRVLYYPAGSTIPTRVYGQKGKFSTMWVNSNGISANSLSVPDGVTLDSSGNLYIADSGNNRVLYYPAGSTTATRVYGQGGSFTTDDADVSATSLDTPDSVALDSRGNLYVADTGNSRVLYYPAGSTTAKRVYGQGGNFSTNATNVGATGLNLPVGVALDSNGNLYISDTGNNRVLYYPAGSTTATRVYGQGGSFSSNTDTNKGGISATSLVHPFGIALDSSNDLYVADLGNSRVLYYPVGSAKATQVYGQAGSFSSSVANNGGVTATSLMYPVGITLDSSSNNLYIADGGDNRVLMFPHG